jgi:O-antigen ligase
VNTRSVPLLSASPLPVAFAALSSALLVGVLAAADIKLAIGLTIALLYVPIVFLNLPIAIALWVGLIFIEYLPAVSIGPTAVGALLAAAWLGTFAQRRDVMRSVIANSGRLPLLLGMLLVWLMVSVAFAKNTSMAAGELTSWIAGLASFVLVATSIDRTDRVRWVIVAFVSGAVASVSVGLVTQAFGGLSGAAFAEGRLQGGAADPNYFAAGIVPAIALAIWLAGSSKRPEHRVLAFIGAVILVIGLLGTQSRGGLVGATVLLIAALVLGTGRRAAIGAGFACLLVVGAVYFTAVPSAWHRVSNFGGDGTGRTDVWRVAWRITGDHPFTGVGIGNFRLYSPSYVRRPGQINRVDIIVGRNVVVHNTYLQLLADTGIPGLLLFLAVVGACLRAQWRAIRTFERRGERGFGGMGRALLAATIGLLTSSFFISNGPDKRLWVLLALGPVMLAIARRTPAAVSEPAVEGDPAHAGPPALRPTPQTTAA